ncbi:MAG: hypothetical protein ND866_09480 [Pyrinomonadaceae bacterium]|nr:hypothetical protein [Pyrinomonadaceae bacterium]
MGITRRSIFCSVVLIASLLASVATTGASSQASLPATSAMAVKSSDLRAEINDFLGKELAAHLIDIKALEPPPDRVVGALTTGEFSWGTFMRALAAYAETTGQRDLAGRDLAKWVGKIGLVEAKGGGKAFSQLYAALALRHFGRDLKTNPLWQSLSPEEQTAWRSLLNPERFYDPRTNKVINLAENYLGVAARIASIGYELGISTDRNFLDRLLDKAAIQFTSGALYADDAPPTGRFDRYSNEYARYVWEAAERAGRKDLLDKLRPSLVAQMRLWWDLVSEDGYGYNWGRSQGIVSYLDTPEIAGFLAAHPEFRPAPLADIAALYYQAWRYLRADFRDNAHLLSLFAFGRGNYAYITREREWQQTTGFFGKLANSHTTLMDALDREGVTSFPTVPTLSRVARFEFFRQNTDRSFGVWLVRQGALRFALPITTGPKPGIANYLPVPYGLAGFSAPVEQIYPAMAPYFELEDGRTIVATDGADLIEPSLNGQTLHVRWNRWALVGAKPGDLVDVGLTSDVLWSIKNNTLTREEILTAKQPLRVRRWKLVVPTTHANLETNTSNNVRVDRFSSNRGPQAGSPLGVTDEGSLEVKMLSASFPVVTRIFAAGDSALGRGVRGAIPLHLVFESSNLRIQPGNPIRCELALTVNGNSTVEKNQVTH